MALTTDVQAAMCGSEDAFSRIVAECANTVCSISLAIVGDVGASEDIAQETFLAAWRGIGNLRNPDSFLPWLRQITRNQAHAWLRDHSREVADDAVVATAIDRRPHPDVALLDEERRSTVREVIDELPDETRETLVLYYREGASTRQVADLLGISEDAVRQRLTRARAVVREETLRRFGSVVADCAPGALFVKHAVSWIAAQSAAIGATSGLAGVLMSRVHLDPPFDEEERIALRRFTLTALWITIAAAITFAAVGYHANRWIRLASLLTFVAIMAHQYFVRLPRILARRLEWERQVNPEIARQRKWQQIYGAVGQAASSAISGIVLMTLLHC
jgi:RNA polymerase sigma factor (sigma-70 family)